MPSTGRALGPFADVSTERVEGAYEVCHGTDEQGRRVEILTLGTTSAKDPARRRMLADAVGWARSTHTPADAPILDVELEAEQPYVVMLREERLRGITRVLDWLLRMGPATGPIRRITTPVPPHLMRVQPVSGPVPPPVSAIPKRKTNGPFVALVVMALVLVVFGGGALAIWVARDSPAVSSDGPQGGDKEPGGKPPGETATEPPRPVIDEDRKAKLPGTESMWDEANSVGAAVSSEPGWPFAWRYDKRLGCDAEEKEIDCVVRADVPGSDELKDARLAVALRPCPGICDAKARAAVLPADVSWTPVDENTYYVLVGTGGVFRLEMVMYVTDPQNPERHWQVLASGLGEGAHGREIVEKSINDVYAQAG
ncbi:hypothetical protein Afil01_53300 [Actinorhabdospora filicis]|uniref:Uncharacterized protein n=1 Tax=Actinorhabdospora filicis TaxID=1785913 RepID=A0A9W6SQJ3_9ACTN|nr:hypothetical protein [Actinorhabdospora filicis]GLZ80523.1 hypothetical protein Afil01_53300 [Actinorhabdospora filicis]